MTSPDIQKERSRFHRIHVIYGLIFLFSLSSALPAYINSTFLAGFTSERTVGLLYTTGAILAIIGLAVTPRLLRRFGNFKVTLTYVLLNTLAFIGLAIAPSLLPVAIAFLLYQLVSRLVFYDHDLLLESYTKNESTGSTRGGYLTIVSLAWAFGPVLAGFILAEDNYWRLFVIAAAIMIFLLVLFATNFNTYHDPKYKVPPIWRTLRTIFSNKDIRKVLEAYFLLRFFYAWMVIYTPIYLHEHIGFEWSTIGIIFTIMLLPFVLLEYPLGRLADSRLGEKELMSIGFVIIAFATISISFISTQTVWIWALALFMTRVGASFVEVMGETYFFKKIDSSDSETIGIFRMTAPLSYVVAPLLASFFLLFIDIRFLFLVLGISLLWGLRYSLTLRDTN